jgi:hypothetical protein
MNRVILIGHSAERDQAFLSPRQANGAMIGECRTSSLQAFRRRIEAAGKLPLAFRIYSF